jgi:hypothetical protein
LPETCDELVRGDERTVALVGKVAEDDERAGPEQGRISYRRSRRAAPAFYGANTQDDEHEGCDEQKDECRGVDVRSVVRRGPFGMPREGGGD